MHYLLVGILLVCTVDGVPANKNILPETSIRLPKLEKKILPPSPFPVTATKRDLLPGHRALTVTPNNGHSKTGDTVTLVCESHAPPPVARILWYEFASSASGQVISDNGNVLPAHPHSARYRIIQAEANHFHLQISNIVLNDGGSYACADIQSGPPEIYSGQAELVVLESDPECTTLVPESGIVLEGQNYTQSCLIRYRGGLNPFMHWSGPDPYQKADIITDTEVVSGIGFTVQRQMDSLSYSCLTNFTERPSTPPGVAGNPPSYSFLNQYNPLYVYWSPKSMFHMPTKSEYSVGDQLICFADGFPFPDFTWQNMANIDIVYNQVFTVTSNMVGQNSSMRCQAQNTIQGILYTQNYFTNVYVPAPTTIPPPTTPPTTTPPIPDGACTNLTGWWLSLNPYAELFLIVRPGRSGQVAGYMRNGTDQFWIEVFGSTRTSDYHVLGLTAIWPYTVGVTGLAAECHRCEGAEVLITAGIWRSIADSAFCGDGGYPAPHTSYAFRRLSVVIPLEKTPWTVPELKLKQATDLLSGQLGLRHPLAGSGV